jgi:putative flippase GtrA
MPATGPSVPMIAGDFGPRSSPELRRLLRFIVAGTVNTAITAGLLVLLASWLAIDIAYTIVYVIGLTFTAFVTVRFVFHRQPPPRATARFLGWYVAVYLLGVTIVHVASSELHSSHLIAVGAVLAVTVPLNFLGGRRIFGVASLPPRP